MGDIKIGDLIYIKPYTHKPDYGINYAAPVIVIGKLPITMSAKPSYIYKIVGMNKKCATQWKIGYCIKDEYVKHLCKDTFINEYKKFYESAWMEGPYSVEECVFFSVKDSKKYNICGRNITTGIIKDVIEDFYIIAYVDDNDDYRQFTIPASDVISRNWSDSSVKMLRKELDKTLQQKIKEEEKLINEGILMNSRFVVPRLRRSITNNPELYINDPVLEYAKFFNDWGKYPSLCIADVYDAENNGLIEEDAIIIIDDNKDRTENSKQVKDEDVSYTCEDELSLFNLCKTHNGEDFFIKIIGYE